MPHPVSEAEKLVRGQKKSFCNKKKKSSLNSSNVAGRKWKWIPGNLRSRCCTAVSFSTDSDKQQHSSTEHKSSGNCQADGEASSRCEALHGKMVIEQKVTSARQSLA